MAVKIYPKWGPYSKKYMGMSRIANHKFIPGVRFDLTVVPSVFGFDIDIPNVTTPNGVHPWESSDDYSFVKYRFDLDGKDKVYAEVSYVRLSSERELVRTEFFNNSDLYQNFLINYFESVEYPDDSYCRLILPKKYVFKDALDYDDYSYRIKRPWDGENPDAMKKGEFLDKRFTGGRGLGDRAPKWHLPMKYIPPFGATAGDKVSYTLDIPEDFDNATLIIRYRTTDIKYKRQNTDGVSLVKGEKTSEFMLNGKERISFEPADEPDLKLWPLGKISKGEKKIELVSLGSGAVELDYLCIVENGDAGKVKNDYVKFDFKPEIKTEKADGEGYISELKYNGVDGDYFLRTFDENTRFRNIDSGCLEDATKSRLSNSDPTFDNVFDTFTSAFPEKHTCDGFFFNTLTHTIYVKPGGTAVKYAVISNGPAKYLGTDVYETIYRQRLNEVKKFNLNSSGKKYELSNDILRATLLTNTVYPIYKHGSRIVHPTPGKRWDSLYTWDSGFIGLGFNEFDEKAAEYMLDAYLSDESNKDYAFVLHGSPVPVQFALWLEMMKKYGSEKLLPYYDRLKLYYDYFTGKIRGSTTGKFKSGLLTPYDYFYSSSGMDDYPAQVEMMTKEIRQTTAPAITSSHAIIAAKIMYMASLKLGKNDDASVYRNDIDKFSSALNKYSWDGESGYYGFVTHNESGEPTGILRTEKGENFDKGLDGIYPFIAGASSESQENAILNHINSDKEMSTPYGISAVDMSASYFRTNGYWNGNIWLPHQWYLWKACLESCRTDLAYSIAKRALDIWKREVEYNYYTFEMFSVVTGRGGWFHNFGGLSTPANIWADAYFKPGTLTTGLETWVDNLKSSPDKIEADISHFDNGKTFSVIACLSDSKDNYSVTLDSAAVPFSEREKGELEFEIKLTDTSPHKLTIE